MTDNPASLVLASASSVRARLLTDAGVVFETAISGVDENPIKEAGEQDGKSAPEIALALAAAKARAVSVNSPSTLVIGADQILACDGKLYDKPIDMAGAADHLRAFSGKPHELITACVLVQEDGVVWQYAATATLAVRDLSETFIETYLDTAGEDVLASVGAYRLEGLGAQLFSHIDGDFFVILGLPLLPLLEQLRMRGMIPS